MVKVNIRKEVYATLELSYDELEALTRMLESYRVGAYNFDLDPKVSGIYFDVVEAIKKVCMDAGVEKEASYQ